MVEQFRTASANGPTVLVMSSVGATGLNLAFANIIIFVVSIFPSLPPHISLTLFIY